MMKKRNQLTLCLLPILFIACSSAPERPSDEQADIYLQLGVRYLKINNLPAAKENLELALQTDGGNVDVHIALAFLYEKLNKFDEAREQYEKSLSMDTENLDLQNNYGRFLCERRESSKGLELLEKASVNMLNRNPWVPLTNAGRCQMAMGNWKSAEPYFIKALQMNPDYAPALQEMQKLSYQNGDYKAAKEYMQLLLQVADYTPGLLWVAIQTENSLGNIEQAQGYTNLLLEKFPFSNEAKQIRAGVRPTTVVRPSPTVPVPAPRPKTPPPSKTPLKLQ